MRDGSDPFGVGRGRSAAKVHPGIVA